jgi:uncharacterized protein YeaO (DUF488 family)
MAKQRISTYRIGSPRKKSDGLRIGAVRLLPRGVPKREYASGGFFDVWLPLVAPSLELLKGFKSGKKSVDQFFRAYRAEMQRPDARHTIDLLATISRQMPIAVGCYCDDESRCHGSVLIKLIRAAGKRK